MDWDFFFGFEGRINRARCWRAMLLNFVCLMMFMMVVPLSIGDSFRNADPKWAMPLTLALLCGTLGPILIVSMWCFAAITIKRLHDRNRSGWWMIPFFVVPPLFNRFDDLLGDSWAVVLLGHAVNALCLWGFIEMLFLRGTSGPNRFGADPLTPADTRPRWDQQSELEFVPHGAGPSPGSHVKRGHD